MGRGRFSELPKMPVTILQAPDKTIISAQVDPGVVDTLKESLSKRLGKPQIARSVKPSHFRHVILTDRVIHDYETKLAHGLGETPHWYYVKIKSSEDRPKIVSLFAVALGAGNNVVPHGLGVAPNNYWIKHLGAATGNPVYEYAVPDATNLYLNAPNIVDVDIGMVLQIDTPSRVKETHRADTDFLYLASDMDDTIVDILVEA